MKVILVPGLVERAAPKVVSQQGRGVFVREAPPELRRLDTDITTADGLYTMFARTGRQPATATTVSRGPASAEVAEVLHSIDKVTAAGRMRYGALPTEN
jgi:DNA-binding GntR family transcriptional regulator